MALAVTFSSVPPVWADELSFITDDDITINAISTIGVEKNNEDELEEPVSDCPFIISGSSDAVVPMKTYTALNEDALGSQVLVFYVSPNTTKEFNITRIDVSGDNSDGLLSNLIKLEEINGVSKYAYDVSRYGTAVVTVNATVDGVAYSQSFTFYSAYSCVPLKMQNYANIIIPFGTSKDELGPIMEGEAFYFGRKYINNVTKGENIVKGGGYGYESPVYGEDYTVDVALSETDDTAKIKFIPTEQGRSKYLFNGDETEYTCNVRYEVDYPDMANIPEGIVVPVFKRDIESLYDRANSRAGKMSTKCEIEVYTFLKNGEKTPLSCNRAYVLNRYNENYQDVLASRVYFHAYDFKKYFSDVENRLFPKGYVDSNEGMYATYDPASEIYGYMAEFSIEYDVKKLILDPKIDRFDKDKPIVLKEDQTVEEAIREALTFTTENLDYSNMPEELRMGNLSFPKTNAEEEGTETVYAPESSDFNISVDYTEYNEKTGLTKVVYSFELTEKGAEAYELADNAATSATVYTKLEMKDYSFTSDSFTLTEGSDETVELQNYLNVSPEGADTTIRFYSENPAIAAVDEKTGVVTAVAPGTAKIYAQGAVGGELGPKVYVTINVLDRITVTFPTAEYKDGVYNIYISEDDAHDAKADYQYYCKLIKDMALVTGRASDASPDDKGFEFNVEVYDHMYMLDVVPSYKVTSLSDESATRIAVYLNRDVTPVIETDTPVKIPKGAAKPLDYLNEYVNENLKFKSKSGNYFDALFSIYNVTENNDSTLTVTVELDDSARGALCLGRAEDYNKPVYTAKLNIPVERVEKQTLTASWSYDDLVCKLNSTTDDLVDKLMEKVKYNCIAFTDGNGKPVDIPYCGKEGDYGYYIIEADKANTLAVKLGFKGKAAEFYDLSSDGFAGIYQEKGYNLKVPYSIVVKPKAPETVTVNCDRNSFDEQKIEAVKSAFSNTAIYCSETNAQIPGFAYDLEFDNIDIIAGTADAELKLTDERYTTDENGGKTAQFIGMKFVFADDKGTYTVSDRELRLKEGASTEAVIMVDPGASDRIKKNKVNQYISDCIEGKIKFYIIHNINGNSDICTASMEPEDGEVLSTEKTSLTFHITFMERTAVNLALTPTDVTDTVIYIMPDDDISRVALGEERVREMFTVTGAEDLSEDDYEVVVSALESSSEKINYNISIVLKNDNYYIPEKPSKSVTITFVEKKAAGMCIYSTDDIVYKMNTNIYDTNEEREAKLKEYVKSHIQLIPARRTELSDSYNYDYSIENDVVFSTEYDKTGMPVSMTATVNIHPTDYAINGGQYSFVYEPIWNIETYTTLALKPEATLNPVIGAELDDAAKALEDYIKDAYNICYGGDDCYAKVEVTKVDKEARKAYGYAELVFPYESATRRYILDDKCISRLDFTAKINKLSYANLVLKEGMTLTPVIDVYYSDDTNERYEKIIKYINNAYTVENADCEYEVHPTVVWKADGSCVVDVNLILPEDYTSSKESVNYLCFKPVLNVLYDEVKPEITSAEVTTDSANIKWTEVRGAQGYRVYVYADGKWTLAGECKDRTEMTAEGLSSNKKYGFAVKALLNDKWTDVTSSDIVYATTADIKPHITKAVQEKDGAVALNWTEVMGADKYRVYVYADGKWTLAGEREELGMYVRNLEAGKKYGFAVKALLNGKWSDVTSSDIAYVTTSDAKPHITKAFAAGNGTVGLNWCEAEGADKYRVYVYADGKWTYAGEREELGMYVRNLTPGKKYGFAVKAYINGKLTDVTSSDIVYVTVK